MVAVAGKVRARGAGREGQAASLFPDSLKTKPLELINDYLNYGL
jgi:hypothetical protein